MIGAVVSWLVGGGFNSIAGQLQKAYQAKLDATNHEQRLRADIDIQRLENAVAMAQAASADRWSATNIGRYTIVLPFGMWWTAIFIDSTFDMTWDVLALPPAIMELSIWLIPAIVVGDVGRSFIARSRR